MKFNNPLILIVVACIGAAVFGSSQPLFGVVFSKVMNLLTVPLIVYEMTEGPDYVKKEIDFWVIITLGVAFGCLIAMAIRGAAFGFLGNNVTIKIRTILYNKILEKDIGFFDLRENNASILTSAMAQDTSQINGASAESLGPYTDAFFALVGGLVIGFYYCW